MRAVTVQITHNLNSIHMCKNKKNMCGIKPHMYNKCTTHTHLSIQTNCHEMIFLTTSSALTLKPCSFYKIEKFVNPTLIFSKPCVLCTYYRLWANRIQRIQPSFIKEQKPINKLSLDTKGLLYKEELTPYKVMNLTLSYYLI